MNQSDRTRLRDDCKRVDTVMARKVIELLDGYTESEWAWFAALSENLALAGKLAVCWDTIESLTEQCAGLTELLAKRSERADSTLVTPDWLRGVGFTDACEIQGKWLFTSASRIPGPEENLLCVTGPETQLLCATVDGRSTWEIRNRDGDSVECGPFVTRAEVLAICAALFIPLIETPVSAQAVENLR